MANLGRRPIEILNDEALFRAMKDVNTNYDGIFAYIQTISDINMRNPENGKTLLLIACEYAKYNDLTRNVKNIEIVKNLIDAGADVNIGNPEHSLLYATTPLYNFVANIYDDIKHKAESRGKHKAYIEAVSDCLIAFAEKKAVSHVININELETMPDDKLDAMINNIINIMPKYIKKLRDIDGAYFRIFAALLEYPTMRNFENAIKKLIDLQKAYSTETSTFLPRFSKELKRRRSMIFTNVAKVKNLPEDIERTVLGWANLPTKKSGGKRKRKRTRKLHRNNKRYSLKKK